MKTYSRICVKRIYHMLYTPTQASSKCLVYPQAEFAEDLNNLGLTVRQACDVVAVKRSCKAKVSYRFICKRLERLGCITPGRFDDVQFQKLEDKIHGVPFYRRRR